MSVTHASTQRDYIANYIADLCDISGPGNIVFHAAASTADSPGTEHAKVPFAATAFSAAASGVVTAQGVPLENSANTTAGTVAFASIQDGAGVVAAHCSVGTAGEDITVSSLNFGLGDTISVTGLTYTAPV